MATRKQTRQKAANAKKTVGGKPIDPAFEHAIPHRYTDEGVEEYNNRPNVDKNGPRVEFVADEFDKKIQQRMDAMEPWQAPDPMQELAEAHVEPGFRARFLSDRVVQRSGTRGWEVVKNEKGDPVRLATMVLAKMPEQRAKQRNAYYQEQAREQARDAIEHYQEEQERLIRDEKAAGVAVLKSNETVRDYQTHRVGQIGLRSVRGNSQEILD